MAAASAAAIAAWAKDRAAAQAILSTYGSSIVAALPDIAVAWVETSASRAGSPPHATAFALARALAAVNPAVQRALGDDVVICGAVQDALLLSHDEDLDVAQRLHRVVDHVRRTVTNSSGGADDDASQFDVLQAAVPAVLGAELLLRKDDAQVVVRHIRAGDILTAQKLVANWGTRYAQEFAVRVGVTSIMDPEKLRQRLRLAVQADPKALYHAMCDVGCIGPAVFSSKACTPPSPLLAPVHGLSMALLHATNVQAAFERK